MRYWHKNAQKVVTDEKCLLAKGSHLFFKEPISERFIVSIPNRPYCSDSRNTVSINWVLCKRFKGVVLPN